MTCQIHRDPTGVTVVGNTIRGRGNTLAKAWAAVLSKLWELYGVTGDYEVVVSCDVGTEALCGCRIPAEAEIRVSAPLK